MIAKRVMLSLSQDFSPSRANERSETNMKVDAEEICESMEKRELANVVAFMVFVDPNRSPKRKVLMETDDHFSVSKF